MVPVGDLLIGEIAVWHTEGLVTVKGRNPDGTVISGGMSEVPSHLTVHGENGHVVDSIDVSGPEPTMPEIESRIRTANREVLAAL